MKYRYEWPVIVLLLFWALCVAVRNTAFELYSFPWFFLLALGAFVVFQAGMIHARQRDLKHRERTGYGSAYGG